MAMIVVRETISMLQIVFFRHPGKDKITGNLLLSTKGGVRAMVKRNREEKVVVGIGFFLHHNVTD